MIILTGCRPLSFSCLLILRVPSDNVNMITLSQIGGGVIIMGDGNTVPDMPMFSFQWEVRKRQMG